MGAVAPMLSLGAGTAQGLRRGSSRRVAYCGSRACRAVFLMLATVRICPMLQCAAQCSMTSTPAKTVRLSVPVTPEVQATFQRLAEVSGKSMAASMSQWLSDTKDAADLMAQNLERLRESPGELVMRVKLHTSAVEDAADLMAENLERLRGSPGDLVMRVKLHTSAVEDAAEEAIEQAISRAEKVDFDSTPGARRLLARDARAGARKPLTPPSSNTGGKVHVGGKKPGV